MPLFACKSRSESLHLRIDKRMLQQSSNNENTKVSLSKLCHLAYEANLMTIVSMFV